jgi:hypothetical protein
MYVGLEFEVSEGASDGELSSHSALDDRAALAANSVNLAGIRHLVVDGHSAANQFITAQHSAGVAQIGDVTTAFSFISADKHQATRRTSLGRVNATDLCVNPAANVGQKLLHVLLLLFVLLSENLREKISTWGRWAAQ